MIGVDIADLDRQIEEAHEEGNASLVDELLEIRLVVTTAMWQILMARS